MPVPDASQLAGLTFVAAVLIIYAGIALARQRRFTALGPRLGAVVVEQGWLAPPMLKGSGFSVEARTRRAGRQSRYYTTVRVAAPDAPESYLLRTGFFENFPNWKHGLALGTRTERAFVVSFSFKQYREAGEDERSALMAWFERRRLFDPRRLLSDLRRLRVREIGMRGGEISITFPGAVSRFDRIDGALTVLRTLAA